MKKRLLSLILAVVMMAGVFIQTPNTAFATNKTVRDTVLILDDSGSMEGEPMNKLIQSAEKFCEAVLNASGTNRVAIVTYSTYAQLKSDFTNNMVSLQSAIRDMDEYGMTNIFDALGIADDLLSKSSADIKNIVLMSDGLPNEGERIIHGKYSYTDYDGYDYANAVYDRASSYHENYFIYTLGFFHNISGDTKAFASRFMEDLQNAGYYEVNKVEDLEFTFGEIAEEITETKITGTFKYPSGAKDYSSTYYYSDEYFYDSSIRYNPSLATMSLCLAMSAFGSGEVSSYKNKSKNVKNLLEELMFTDFETTKSFTEKPTTDSIAAAIGQKKIKDKDGHVFTLIAVAVRGGGYEQEWASNFTIGDREDHAGFNDAALHVIKFIKNYVGGHGIEGDVKLWITGYSRAAATSNLVAARLDEGTSIGNKVSLSKTNLFAYCFETPAGTTVLDANTKSKYGNIFNIVNPNDLVTKVAPTAMGFRRYGIDRVLPTRENKYNSYSKQTEEMLKQFKQIESAGDYKLNNFVYKKIDIGNIAPWRDKDIVYEADEQMSMSAFLDDLLAKLVNGYIHREVYFPTIEMGVRELCKALFQDESKSSKIIDSTVEKISGDIGGIIWAFFWDEYSAYEKIAGYLTESLKENGITNFNDSDIKEAAKPLLDCVIACLANNIDDFVTIINNKDYFFPAHNPELCLAWMRSMDENYTTDAGEAFSNGSYRVIRINCPVNISVYDTNGTLVALIVDGVTQLINNSSITALINSDGEKIVYLPPDEEFKIEITGTDSGNVSYGVNEFSFDAGQVSRVVNYYDVPIEKGKSLNAIAPAYDDTYLNNETKEGTNTKYVLTDMDGNSLKPDLDISGTLSKNIYHSIYVTSENTEHGTVSGSGIKPIGSYAKVVAIANEGYVFEGWYVENKKVSTDEEYRFCVKEDVELVAKFSSTTSTSSGKIDNSIWIIIAIIIILLAIIGGVVILVMFMEKKSKQESIDMVKEPILINTVSDENKENITEDVKYNSGTISVLTGSMNGFSIPIKDGETLYLGKDQKVANLVFTGDYKNVSRLHCSVTYDAKTSKYYVVDSSSNGTFVGKKRLIKGKRTPVESNTIIALANEDCSVLLG